VSRRRSHVHRGAIRTKAAESAESIKHTDVPSEISEFARSMQSFRLLAQMRTGWRIISRKWSACGTSTEVVPVVPVMPRKRRRVETARQKPSQSRGTYSANASGGRDHAMERDPNGPSTRAVRHRGLTRRRAATGALRGQIGPFPAQPRMKWESPMAHKFDVGQLVDLELSSLRSRYVVPMRFASYSGVGPDPDDPCYASKVSSKTRRVAPESEPRSRRSFRLNQLVCG